MHGPFVEKNKTEQVGGPQKVREGGPIAPQCPNWGPGLSQGEVGPVVRRGPNLGVFFELAYLLADNTTEWDVDPTSSHKVR